jgi:hypothetical protein
MRFGAFKSSRTTAVSGDRECCRETCQSLTSFSIYARTGEASASGTKSPASWCVPQAGLVTSGRSRTILLELPASGGKSALALRFAHTLRIVSQMRVFAR